MQCFYPISIRDPVGKNASQRITVPCGKCVACLSNRRSEWATRLEQELKDSKTAHFLTLTYAVEPSEKGSSTLVKADVQKWLKRLRKALNGQKIKYYLCGEYGSRTFRPHYHAIVFGLPHQGEKLLELLLKTWKHGFVSVGTVTPKSINYTLKYMLQGVDERKRIYDGRQIPFATMSKNMGLRYVKTHFDYHQDDITRNYVTTQNGVKKRLPRYYRLKIYTDEQRRLQNDNRPVSGYTKLYDEFGNVISQSLETMRIQAYEAQQELEKQRDFERRVKKSLKNNGKL